MNPWLIGILRFLAAVGLMLGNGVILIYMLRKVLGRLHIRLGPMEQGPQGIFQTIFDVLKLLTKEDITPTGIDKALFFIAPAIVFVPSLMSYIILPFSRTWVIGDFDLGLLFLFAVQSIVPLGILAAGWASNNKWSLIGGLRAVGAQITYEVPLLLSVIPIVMMTGSMNLGDIVAAQSGTWLGFLPKWFIVNIPSFLMFAMAGLMENGQVPFDLAEGESELVGGFATEYSSMKFGLMFLAEFSNTFILSAMITTLFFGGWQLPWVSPDTLSSIGLLPPVIFMIKTYFGIFLIMAIRGTWPRVRVDHLLELGWKFMLPVSLAWVMIVGVILKLVQGGGVR